MSKNIVIVGASSTGHPLATTLAKSIGTDSSIRILIIDPSPIAYWPIASLRAAVVPGWESKISRTLTKDLIFPAGSHHDLVRAKVTKLGDGYVEIDGDYEGSNKISFAALALCTGATQSFPQRQTPGSTVQDVEAELVAMQKAIAASTKVLVVGGGPTGIEFAGEVRSAHPKTSITLLHGGDALLDPRYPLKASKSLEQKLIKQGIKVILGERIDVKDVAGKQEGVKVFKTESGVEIEADFIFWAGGNVPNSGLMKDADPSVIGEQGLIKVDDKLRVISPAFPSSNVFALGDVADTSSNWRSLISAQADCVTASHNILALLRAEPLQAHKAGMKALIVPIGPNDGGGFLPALPIWGEVLAPAFMVKMVKGKTLFVEKFEERFLKA